MKNIHQIITETVPVFFFTFNSETHLIEYISPQFYDYVTIREDKEQANPHEKFRSIIHPDFQSKFQHFFHDLSKKNKFESSVELKTDKETCKIEWLELNTFKPTNKSTGALLIVGHLVDITSKKKQYEILKKENERIENIMNMMAHDLKGPLTNISLIADLLKEIMSKEEKDQYQKYLNILKVTSRDSGKLIDRLLEIATLKGETSKLDLDLHDLRYTIKEVVEKMDLQISEKKIDISCSFPDYSVEALLDAPLFEQVIQNLLGNALKFTPDGGSILFSLSYSKKGHIELSITDSGIEIPEENMENLFNDISAIKRPGLKGEKSTGLGLFICSQIIKIHEGSITAKSKNNEGSTFQITLPIPEASSAYY